MNNSILILECPIHENEKIYRFTLDEVDGKRGFCISCILEMKPEDHKKLIHKEQFLDILFTYEKANLSHKIQSLPPKKFIQALN